MVEKAGFAERNLDLHSPVKSSTRYSVGYGETRHENVKEEKKKGNLRAEVTGFCLGSISNSGTTK